MPDNEETPIGIEPSAVEADDVRAEAPHIPIPVFTETSRPAIAPEFMVVDGVFFAQTDVGEISTTLRIPERLMKQMIELVGQREQFELLLGSRDESATIERMGELDSIDAYIVRSKFFQAHLEREQARLGESFGSSTS